MHVKDLMSHPVVTCQSSDHLDIPARLMWEYDCGVVPVVDPEGRLTGMVTDRDIAMAAYTRGLALRQIPVGVAMAKNVLAVHPEESVESVERLMQQGRVRRIPVIDASGRPVGIVSLNDVTLATARTHRSLEDRELVETMAAVCRPRFRRSERVPSSTAPKVVVTAT